MPRIYCYRTMMPPLLLIHLTPIFEQKHPHSHPRLCVQVLLVSSIIIVSSHYCIVLLLLDQHARFVSEVDTSVKLTRNRQPLTERYWKTLFYWISAIGWSG